jgi:addiction module HigA family antidote
MIKSFNHKGLEIFFETGSKRGIQPGHAITTITTMRKKMQRTKRRPTHPGKILKEDYLLPLSLTIKDMAENLGVSRKAISKIINERGPVTPDMALRLSRAFDTTPDLWLNLQKNYDLWQVETGSQEWKKVKPFPQAMLHSSLEG